MRGGAAIRGAVSCAASRLIETALILGGAIIVALVIGKLMPGDPVSLSLDGQHVSPELMQKLRETTGIDQPLWQRFTTYLTALAHGDLGTSWRYEGTSVVTLIVEGLPTTLVLLVGALIIAAASGITAGVLSARWPGTVVAGMVTAAAGSAFAFAMSPVVVATWLVLAGPVVHAGAIGGFWGRGGQFFDLIAATGALALGQAGTISRATRVQLLEVLSLEFLLCARAKGLSEWAVLLRHALPNAMTAIATTIGSAATTILTSTAVVETVFNLPGLGRLAIGSVLSRDYPLVAAIVVVFVFAQVVISVATDMVIFAIDPRIREERGGR